MKIIMKFIVTIMISLFFQCDVMSQNIQNLELSKEIRNMRDEDQKLRKKYGKLAGSGKTETKKFKELTTSLIALDRNHTERMKVIIEEYGWPTYSLVGKKASVSAWLLVQHADRDPFFQKECLPLLKTASDNGESDLVNYAYLYDRVQIAKGEKQLYATQSTTNSGITQGNFQPIDDEPNVQNRRAEMGFDKHVETYAKDLGFTYKIPNKEKALSKSKGYEASYEEHILKAKESLTLKDYDNAVNFYLEALKSNGSCKTEDFVEAAKALSLSEHKESYLATYYLITAVLRGYENSNSFLVNNDFNYVKKQFPRNWKNLEDIIKTSND